MSKTSFSAHATVGTDLGVNGLGGGGGGGFRSFKKIAVVIKKKFFKFMLSIQS
jgi:hypothetical protein